jgi:hypothetical protein
MMEKITIEIDSKWKYIARSPLYYIVQALQGVAITFAPLFLYWCGKWKTFQNYELVIVPICFALIYFVPLFYYVLGRAVMKELVKK